MELEEVERLGLQVVQAALYEVGQVLAVIATSCMGIEPPPRLGRDDQLLAPGLAYLSDQLLRVSITIDIGSIDEIHSKINSPVKGRQ